MLLLSPCKQQNYFHYWHWPCEVYFDFVFCSAAVQSILGYRPIPYGANNADDYHQEYSSILALQLQHLQHQYVQQMETHQPLDIQQE